MDRRVTLPKRVTSPTRGPPPSRKQALRKKSKLPGHVIDHALYCSKIDTNESHRVLSVKLKFYCIKTLT